jgi:S1-C subfamily serine protease
MTSPSGGGALVTQVIPGGPADQAGLQQTVVDSRSVGDEVLLQINRGGQVEPIGVTLGRRPAASP